MENIVAANWKMYKNPEECTEFLEKFIELLPKKNQKQVYIFPQSVCLTTVQDYLIDQNANILTGGQNCHTEIEGAFTGEISAKVLKDMEVESVLIGHSERRTLFKEDNELLSRTIDTPKTENLNL